MTSEALTISPELSTPSDVRFSQYLRDLLPQTGWIVSTPDDCEAGVHVIRVNTSSAANKDNGLSVWFNWDSMKKLGMTGFLTNPEQAAVEAYVHLSYLATEADSNPKLDLLRTLMPFVQALRPEWVLSFKEEDCSVDDWFTMEFSVDGFPYKASLHAFTFNYEALGLSNIHRWVPLTQRSIAEYEEAARRVVRKAEKEAKQAAKAKSPKKGFWESLLGA